MSYDISLCHICLEPIWFPWGLKTHVGTGWECWKKQQEQEEEELPGIDVIEFVFGTEAALLLELVQQAMGMYQAWSRNARAKSPVPFLAKQLAKGRGDVVHEVLAELAKRKDSGVRALVSELVRTDEWRAFARTARRRAAEKPSSGKGRRGSPRSRDKAERRRPATRRRS